MPAPASHARGGVASLTLLAVTAVWGSTFSLIKDAVTRMPVADFLAVRFVVATAVMWALLGRHAVHLPRHLAARGLALGACYGFGQVLQTLGLDRTSASTAGFVTGMYVVLTPILGRFLLGQRVSRSTATSVTVATLGLAVLSLDGFSVGVGEILVLASTLLYALHVVGLGAWSSPRDALGLAAWQVLGIAVVCSAFAVPGGLTLPPDSSAWFAIGYTAVVSGAAGLLLQTWSQAHLTPTRAAIIMTSEPVFAALFAVLLGGESLTTRTLLGGGMVVAAMLLVELRPRRSVWAAEDPPVEALHHEA